MDIQSLVGRVVKEIVGGVGEEEMRLIFSDGTVAEFYHPQDCCEYVRIEDIEGDLEDLVGETLVVAEEVSNSDAPEGFDTDKYDKWDDSHTWTFYRFATNKGWVVVRWLGESNGYYSESVSLVIHD
ncbi:hypothetical protein FBPa8_0017 [Pseudomonas phage vB_PaeP_FBPa8]|nr:hypothetical protein FBPa8_0017 [Pseudomonas phage vB_PaeP_FBPa8]